MLLASEKTRERKRRTPQEMGRVASIILGGGQGKRLFPLTHTRCKPATPFGGRYCLIDIPISNSINSHIEKIFVITQFLASPLHRHILQTYRFDGFSTGFIELLAAEQKPTSSTWFQGTADAVRQNIEYIAETPVDYFLILSGDQLYNIDFQHMIHFGQQTDADLIVATLPVVEAEAQRAGIMKIDEQCHIVDFQEKPETTKDLKRLKSDPAFIKEMGLHVGEHRCHLASMGIYLFKREALFNLLQEDVRHDFGQHLIPTMVSQGKAAAYLYDGYWEDIGTIDAFYQANLALMKSDPLFNLYDEANPIYGRTPHLPGPRISNTQVVQSIICEGSIIDADEVSNSILGNRTVVEKGSIIRDSYIMGNDFYEPPIRLHNRLPEVLSIGQNCLIQKAIIDKNVRIGDGVRLTNKDNLTNHNGDGIYIRDGVIVVNRGADLPDGFVL